MRCPKCGAFMEEGKDVCFMCGVNVRTYVPQNNNMNFNNGYNNNNVDPAFGSGANFNNGNLLLEVELILITTIWYINK